MKYRFRIIIIVAALLAVGFAPAYKYGAVNKMVEMLGSWYYPSHPTFSSADSLRIPDKKYVDNLFEDVSGISEIVIGNQISDSLNALPFLGFEPGLYMDTTIRSNTSGDTIVFNSTIIYRTGALATNDSIGLGSNVYTPTAADATNCSSVTPSQFNWSRDGNMIIYSGSVTYTVTSGGASTSFTLTIPVSIELAAPVQATGNGTDYPDFVPGRVTGYSGSATKVIFETKPTSTGAHSCTLFLQYRIK